MNTTPKRVLIGTLKWHPRKIVTKAGYSTSLMTPEVSEPGYYEWIDTFKRGLLQGFFTEGDEDGTTVVGLVELDDGHFDTFAAACLKLETPTPNTAP